MSDYLVWEIGPNGSAEPRPATSEEVAQFIRATEDTDPDLCTCGHGGLARGYHWSGCEASK